MNLKKTLFVLICAVLITPALAQTSIEYRPKALLKTLQKAGITDVSAIKEFALPDSLVLQHTIHGKFFRIEANNINQYKYIYVGRVNSCRAGGCSIAHNVSTDADSEYFDYFIIFDKNHTVQTVKVFNYQATHGQEVTSKGWLKQFVGHNGSEPLQVDKNIDSISGATISVYALTADVELKTEIIMEL